MADQLMLDKIKGILFLFIMISLFVAIFNLFPIPLLDGGHIIYFTLRSMFSNALPQVVTRLYIVIGISIISFLFILVTINDTLVKLYLEKSIKYISIHKLLIKLLKKPYFVKYYDTRPKNINDIKNMVNKVKKYLLRYSNFNEKFNWENYL